MRAGFGPWVAVALGSACAERVPLSQVPIRGGTAAQRTEARRVIDAFVADAGADRVRLTEVAFEPIYGAVAGRFEPLVDRVLVDPDVHGPLLERVVRHELCHALDWDEGLLAHPHPVFDALVLDLFRVGAVDTEGLEGPRLRRSEAFAQYCEMGPLFAQALAAPCPGEREDVSFAAAWLLQRVWREWEPPASHPAHGIATGSWLAPDPRPFDDDFGVLGLVDPSRIRVQYGSTRLDLALDPGGPASGPPAPVYAPQEELPDGLSGLCPLYGFIPAGAGWSDGPAAVLMQIDVYADLATTRVLASDGGAWGWVEGCVMQEHADIFVTADHRIWLASVDDRTLSWAPLLE